MKGGLLIIFSVVLTIYILNKGLEKEPYSEHHEYASLGISFDSSGDIIFGDETAYLVRGNKEVGDNEFFLLDKDGVENWYHFIHAKRNRLQYKVKYFNCLYICRGFF